MYLFKCLKNSHFIYTYYNSFRENENNEELQQLRIENQELESTLQQIEETHKNTVESVRDAMKRKMIDLETKMQESRRELKNQVILKDQEKLQELQIALTALKTDNVTLTNKLKDTEKLPLKINELTAELKAVKLMSDEKSKELERKLNTIEAEKKELSEKLAEKENLQDRIDDLVAEIQAAKVVHLQSTKTMETQLKTREREMDELNKRIQETVKENVTLKQSHVKTKDLTEQYEILRDKNEKLIEELTTIRQDVDRTFNQQVQTDEEFLRVVRKVFDKAGRKNNDNIFQDRFKLLKELQRIYESNVELLQNKTDQCNKLNEKVTLLEKTNDEGNQLLLQDQNKMKKEIEELTKALHDKENVKEEKDKLNNEVQKLQMLCEEQKASLVNSEIEQKNLVRKVDSLKKLVNDSKSALTTITKEKNNLNEVVKELKNSFEMIESSYLNTVAEKEKFANEIARYKQLCEEKSNSGCEEQNKLVHELQELQSELTRILNERNMFAQDVNKLRKMVEEKEEGLNKQVIRLEKQLGNNNTIIYKLQEERGNILAEKESLISRINQFQITLGELKEIKKQNTLLEEKLVGLNEVQANYHKLIEEMGKNKTEVQQLQNERDILVSEVNGIKLTFTEEQADSVKIKIDRDELKEKVSNLECLLLESRLLVSDLNTKIENQEERLSHWDVLDRNLQAKNTELDELKKQMEDVDKLREMLKEKEECVSDLLHEREKILEKLENQNRIEENLHSKMDLLTNAQEEIARLRESQSNVVELQQSVELLQGILKDKEALLQEVEAEKELQEKTAIITDLEGRINDLVEKVAILQYDNKEMCSKIEESKASEVIESDSHALKSKESEEQLEKLRLEKQNLQEDALRQIKQLEMDLTRLVDERETNVQYHQNEIAKLRNKNDKLESKLDETLVTLNHCTELSSSTTEMQYLKNVLFNYMMGKESIVLARVIAAVCKFDTAQTDAVIQKEQQRQTLVS